jgi:deazaflavin-dependent oxidoreductase (nitroreductase family)
LTPVAKRYRLHAVNRAVNAVFRTMTRLGVGAGFRHVLTVRGRKTGRVYSTPVDVMEYGGSRWLVAGYGVVSWVWNVRASGEVRLSRGGRAANYLAEEVHGAPAVPVLRQYMRDVPVTRRYFDVKPDASDAAVLAELPRHPVFRLTPVTTVTTLGTP